MPAISRAGQSLVLSADVADSRLSSRVEIVHATGQVGGTQVEAWVKNTGATQIIAIPKSDVFFGPQTDFQRVTYGGQLGGPACTAPCWQYALENDTQWNPTATLHVRIFLAAGSPLVAGTAYYVKVVAPTGVEDSKFFTL